MIRIAAFICLSTVPAVADVVTPIHTIRANTVIMVSDLKTSDVTMAGVVTDPLEIAGLEAKRNLYAGRPIRPSDVGPAAIIERNQIVTLKYNQGGLQIETEGRALGRGGLGDQLRVLNLASRNTVSGRVDQSGAVIVGQ